MSCSVACYRELHVNYKAGYCCHKLSVRPSVYSSVCLSVCKSVTITYCGHIHWFIRIRYE